MTRWTTNLTVLFASLVGVASLSGCRRAPDEGGGAAGSSPRPSPPASARPPAVPSPAEVPAASAPPPVAEATRARAELTLANLEKWVKPGATDPRNAWALAHGIVAFGKDLVTSDGRKAIDVMIGDFAERAPGPSGESRWTFPTRTATGIPVAPHRDLLIKTALEARVPLEHTFKTRSGETVSLAQLVADAEEAFQIPGDDAGWRNYAWSATALLTARAKEGQVRTSRGPIPLATLAELTIARLEQEQRLLEELMVAGAPERVEKNKQGIFAHHCGGLHLVQAAALAAATTKKPEHLRRVRRQLDVVLFRWDAERRIYADALRQQPQYRWILLVQQLKFFGHVLETFALARDYGVFPGDPQVERKLRQITSDLADSATALEAAYVKPEVNGSLGVQTRYDLVGDGGHAIRALRKALVAFFPS